MKLTILCALALSSCLPSLVSAQGLRPLGAPRFVPPGTLLTDSSAVFSRAAYNAVKADYAWLTDAVRLKNQRLAGAAAVDTTTTWLLIQAQADLATSRKNEAASFHNEQELMAKYSRALAGKRPFLLLDKRLYLGGGIGLGLGATLATYLWARLH